MEIHGTAIVLSGGLYDTKSAKTTHGLVRGSDRFHIVAVIDPRHGGRDAGEILDGKNRGIPIFSSVMDAVEDGIRADYCIVGVAPKGGRLPHDMRDEVVLALKHQMDIVSGLHQFLNDDHELSEMAIQMGRNLFDIRKPRPRSELSFWTGEVDQIGCPKIAVMGTDCGLGKRTTAKMIVDTLRSHRYVADMIFTGQTGWMQGWRYGFILDSTYNDFVSGELEHMMVKCWKETQPQFMVIEGQAALRNPSGPCGAEFLVSGAMDAVVLQHAPARIFYDGFEALNRKIPPIRSEIELIKAYGVPVVAITLNTKGLSEEDKRMHQERIEAETGLPVFLPVEEGLEGIIPILESLLK
jgi:uncharacterized NAD-dependent epimerase/dehydratase family protein